MPVENTKLRARFQSQSLSCRDPTTNAPCSPSAFPAVPTRTSGRTPATAHSPRPSDPKTPSECASSTINAASCSSQSARSRGRSGLSPSMLKYASVTTHRRRAPPALSSAASTASGVERAGTTTTSAPGEPAAVDDRRVVERVRDDDVPRPASAASTPDVRGVARREEQGAASAPSQSASAPSASSCAGSSPLTRRDAPAPLRTLLDFRPALRMRSPGSHLSRAGPRLRAAGRAPDGVRSSALSSRAAISPSRWQPQRVRRSSAFQGQVRLPRGQGARRAPRRPAPASARRRRARGWTLQPNVPAPPPGRGRAPLPQGGSPRA